jgi:hypothetical protein
MRAIKHLEKGLLSVSGQTSSDIQGRQWTRCKNVPRNDSTKKHFQKKKLLQLEHKHYATGNKIKSKDWKFIKKTDGLSNWSRNLLRTHSSTTHGTWYNTFDNGKDEEVDLIYNHTAHCSFRGLKIMDLNRRRVAGARTIRTINTIPKGGNVVFSL